MHGFLMMTDLLNYLVRDGLLTSDDAEIAKTNVAKQRISLAQYLVNSGTLSSNALLLYCAKNFAMPIFDLRDFQIDWITHAHIPTELIFRYRIIPLYKEQNHLNLGMADPTNQAAIAAIGFHTGLRIRPMLVDETKLNKLITDYYKTIAQNELQSTLSKLTPYTEAFLEPIEVIDDQEKEEPIIEFVDRFINDAIEKQISDIHLEPEKESYRIRFRRDGFLYQAATFPKQIASRIITRLKILANVNIAERRLPQDGRIHFHRAHKDDIDIRLNTCPTIFGEKIVLRMLDASSINLDMNSLGFSASQQQTFIHHIKQPQGLILVTGPTGSGKTTTLYSALHYLNQIEKNIISIEDPVEIELPGINQININPRIGLDFANVLSAILRQDPDVIMVGEIRDFATAEIAMQAAQTGHLVLSTVHTNSAIDTITRLQAMNIPAHYLINSISLIIAQRLMRKNCMHCANMNHASGCDDCHQGYKGRFGIYEFLTITDELSHLILSGANKNELLQHAKKHGHQQLCDLAHEQIEKGMTTMSELSRVLGIEVH